MSKLKLGKPAPDVTLFDQDEKSVRLSDTWSQGQKALLIFLRHLG